MSNPELPVGLPFQSQSPESQAAAEAALPFVGNWRRRVFDHIEKHPGSSDQDIQGALKMNPNTERPRRIELECEGLIRPCGQTTTPKGSKGVCYEVTGKPYPDKWPTKGSSMRKRRAEKPTPEEIKAAVETMRRAYEVMNIIKSKPFEAVVQVIKAQKLLAAEDVEKLVKASSEPFSQSAIEVLQWLARQS